MPRTRSLAWSELKIGIVAVVALALAVMIILAVGGAAGFSWQRYHLVTKFPDVKGLKSGAVVRVAGVEIGKVTDVRFVGAEVEIAMEVRDDMQSRITTESRASIGSLSLLGEPVIDISPSTSGTPLKDHDTVLAGRTPGQLSDVAESATQSLGQINGLLADLRAGKGTVGKLFTDDDLYREINAFVVSAQQVAGHAEQRQRHAGVADQGSGGLQPVERRAREPAADERSHQRRRGQPRAPAQG